MHSKNQLYETLALGIYNRFKKKEPIVISSNDPNVEQIIKITEEVIEDPYNFEEFVALIMQDILGGKAETTKKSGDFGIDIKHAINGDLFLAQVKCYKPSDKITYEPISILHSNIVKNNAKGGYFVTTSSYNENALKYADGLGIELISGHDLAMYWLGKKESWLNQPLQKGFFDLIFEGIDRFFEELFNPSKEKKQSKE
ncbi:restriction endonuclease [Domibacillus indicus]|uniref:restriction endonuclease n=1 Tax=Domibacillus indicus TaxID=1437523 RepID=UPI00203E7149|nr:restriction endonuclease [Domibacillus indicus]MCM3790344.1 restriction endonuclease [Domibacillus indicus]